MAFLRRFLNMLAAVGCHDIIESWEHAEMNADRLKEFDQYWFSRQHYPHSSYYLALRSYIEGLRQGLFLAGADASQIEEILGGLDNYIGDATLQ